LSWSVRIDPPEQVKKAGHFGLKERKLTFKIVGIGSASIFHLHTTNAHDSMNVKASYYQYLPNYDDNDRVLIVTMDVGLGNR
jgi:hypothetical protein